MMTSNPVGRDTAVYQPQRPEGAAPAGRPPSHPTTLESARESGRLQSTEGGFFECIRALYRWLCDLFKSLFGSQQSTATTATAATGAEHTTEAASSLPQDPLGDPRAALAYLGEWFGKYDAALRGCPDLEAFYALVESEQNQVFFFLMSHFDSELNESRCALEVANLSSSYSSAVSWTMRYYDSKRGNRPSSMQCAQDAVEWVLRMAREKGYVEAIGGKSCNKMLAKAALSVLEGDIPRNAVVARGECVKIAQAALCCMQGPERTSGEIRLRVACMMPNPSVPVWSVCPYSRLIMVEPVRTACGVAVEKSTLTRYSSECCPAGCRGKHGEKDVDIRPVDTELQGEILEYLRGAVPLGA